jgi:5-methylthioadenosine/S-adenosylhomocysteine deaminase
LRAPHFAGVGARCADLARVRRDELADDTALVTMAAAASDLPICGIHQLQAELAAARDLGLRISLHSNTWEYPERPPEIALLHEHGLLADDLLLVHANLATDEELRMAADAGAAIVSTPETEMQMSMGPAVIGRFARFGGKPSFGCDIISNNSGGVLVQARLGLQVQRMLDNAPILAEHRAADEVSLSTVDILRALTVNAAEAIGLGGRIGRLVPGMAADVILVRTDAINTMPVHAPVATLLLHAHPGNVDTVIVGGRVLKQRGKLCADLARARRELLQSHDYVNRAISQIEMNLPAGYRAG